MQGIQQTEHTGSLMKFPNTDLAAPLLIFHMYGEYRPVVLNWFGYGTHIFPLSSSCDPIFGGI